MAKQDINIGTTPNDGTGDTLRDAFDKANDNFTENYSAIEENTTNIAANRVIIDSNEERVTLLEDNQYSGVSVYDTLADLPATGTLLVSYKVSNDTTSSNNGYYHWDGSAYIKDASLAEGVIESGDTDPVSGDTVFEMSETQAIQLLHKHNPTLVFSGFAKVGDSTPAHSANKAYIATESGTVYGETVLKGQLIIDDGTVFSVEYAGFYTLGQDLDADGFKGTGFAAGSDEGDLVEFNQAIIEANKYYPFVSPTPNAKAKAFILDLEIYGYTGSDMLYVSYITRNNGGVYRFYISKDVGGTATQIAVFTQISGYTESEDILLAESGGSGVTGKAKVDWSVLSVGESVLPADVPERYLFALSPIVHKLNSYNEERNAAVVQTNINKEDLKSINYPFAENSGYTQQDEEVKAIRDVLLIGTPEVGYDYYIRVIRNNPAQPTNNAILIYKSNDGLATSTLVSTTALNDFPQVNEDEFVSYDIAENSGSGVTAKVLIKWDEVTEGANVSYLKLMPELWILNNTEYYKKFNYKKNYPFIPSAVLVFDDAMLTGIRDFAVKSGSLFGKGICHLSVSRNVTGNWTVILYSDSTALAQYSVSSAPDNQDIYQIIELSEVSSSGVSAYVMIRWSDFTSGVLYEDSTKYKLSDSTLSLLNTTAFYANANFLTQTNLTATSINASSDGSVLCISAVLGMSVKIGDVINITFDNVLVSGDAPIITFRHGGITGIITMGTTGSFELIYNIVADDANAYFQVQYNSGSAGSFELSNLAITKTSSLNSPIQFLENSKFIYDRLKIIEQEEAAKNNENNIAYLDSIAPIADVQLPTAELNQIILYGQSLSVGAESYVQLTTTNVKGNQTLGTTPHYVTGVTTLNDLIAGTSSTEHEPCVIHASNKLKIELDKYFQDLTVDRKMLASANGQGGSAIEQLSKDWAEGLLAGKNAYDTFVTGLLTDTAAAATAAGKTLVCPAIMWMQGEANSVEFWGDNMDGTTPSGTPDHTKAGYKAKLLALKNDMQADIMAAYSQEKKPLFIMYVPGQHHTRDFDVPIQMAFIEFMQENDDVIISNPTYPSPDFGSHLTSNGYRMLGEVFAKQLYYALIKGEKRQPLRPRKISKTSNKVIIDFLVPKPPLVLDLFTVYEVDNYGFQIKDDAGYKTISSIVVKDTYVELTCSSSFTGDVLVNYAGYKTPGTSDDKGHGNLRDSDPWVSLYNWEDDDDGVHVPAYDPLDSDGATLLRLSGNNYGAKNWCLPFYYEILSSESVILV